MIKKTDVNAVVAALKVFSSDIRRHNNLTFNQSPAVKVINSVLSLGISYENYAEPRLKEFEKNRPDVTQVTELKRLIACYSTRYEFLDEELKSKNKRKGEALNEVVKRLCNIIETSPTHSEEEAIRQWAIDAKPEDYRSPEWDIKGFRICGFQWLRMLFGAETTKPDTRIRNFLRDILKRDVLEMEAVCLIKEASENLKLPERKVDSFIWDMMSKWRVVPIAPDLEKAFPTNSSVNEALRSLLKQ